MAELFSPGTIVAIILNGETVGQVRVISDSRSEMRVRRLDGDHREETFAYKPKMGGWVLLFEGLGSEICYNENGPVYQIERAVGI